MHTLDPLSLNMISTSSIGPNCWNTTVTINTNAYKSDPQLIRFELPANTHLILSRIKIDEAWKSASEASWMPAKDQWIYQR